MIDNIAVVTGGAGFIGSHMVDVLLDHGFKVRVVDNLSGGHRSNLQHRSGQANLTCHWDDIRGLKPDSPIFEGARFVFHFAGIGDIVHSIVSPYDYMDVHVQVQVEVMEVGGVASVD